MAPIGDDPTKLIFTADTRDLEAGLGRARGQIEQLRGSLSKIKDAAQTDDAVAELDALERELDQVEKELDQATAASKEFSETGKGIDGVRAQVSKLNSAWRSFLAVFGVSSLAAIGVAALKTSGDFEQLKVRLETLTGSAEGAERAFSLITRFAAKTPFQVNEITESFARLKAQGVDPTEASLRSIGDTAAANGKNILQYTEALLDAQTFQFERLKEFGITASAEGDRVAFTFKGVTTEVGKGAEEIRNYLLSIGDTDFAGAMERQSKTLLGAFSNLQDSLALLSNSFGESGLAGEVGILARKMGEAADSTGKAGSAVTTIGKAIAFVVGSLAPLGDFINSFFRGVVGGLEGIAAKITQAGGRMVEAFGSLAEAVGLDEFGAKLRRAGEDARFFGESLQESAEENVTIAASKFEEGKQAFSELIDRIAEAGRVAPDAGSAIDSLGDSAGKAAPQVRDLAAATKATADASGVAAESKRAEVEATRALVQSIDEEAKARARAAEEAIKAEQRRVEEIARLESQPVLEPGDANRLFDLRAGGPAGKQNEFAVQAEDDVLAAKNATEQFGQALSDAELDAQDAFNSTATGAEEAWKEVDKITESLDAAREAGLDLGDVDLGGAYRESEADQRVWVEQTKYNAEKAAANIEDGFVGPVRESIPLITNEAAKAADEMVRIGDDGKKSIEGVGQAIAGAERQIEQLGETATRASEGLSLARVREDAEWLEEHLPILTRLMGDLQAAAAAVELGGPDGGTADGEGI